MTFEKRLEKIEAQVTLRCRHCGRPLRCDHCEYGKDIRECSNEELLDIIAQGMKRLAKEPSFFNSLGYDLSRLAVEELKQLRALLTKADPAAEETP
jgi:hypothetical protein